ncbi:MAG: YfhO family protein [Lachnospiraceae bacterium]|nr:YfhO family protein [Lachnospiraceae bacterium]
MKGNPVDLKKLIQNQKMQVFILNFMIAFFALIPLIVRNGGLFTLCDDFNNQTIPLSMLTNEAIKAGNIFWNWNIDMGSSFIGATSFYTLGDPFFLITLLFPKSWFPYLTGWLSMLKYAVAGWLSYCYMERYFRDKKYAIIGSVLFSFSGFQIMNMMFQFHGSIALSPLMLIGVDKLVLDDKKGYLAIGVFVNACANFYVFTSEVIFCILYFTVRFFMENRLYYKKILHCILEGILGICMAMVLYLPSIAFTLLNPRSYVLLPMERWFELDRRALLYLLRAFVLPAESMCRQSFIYDSNYASKAACLSMIGMALVFCYMIKMRKTWLTRLLVTLACFSVVPFSNSLFNLCSDTNYYRWLYMFAFFMAMASVLVLERRKEFPALKCTVVYFVGMVLFYLGSVWWDKNKFQLIFDRTGFQELFIIAAAGIIITIVCLCLPKNKNVLFLAFLCSISVFSALMTYRVCDAYQAYARGSVESGNGKPVDYYDKMIKLQQIQELPEEYRVDSADNTINMVVPFAGTGSFLSTVNGSIYDFYDALHKERKLFTPELDHGTVQLLSAKYYVTQEKQEDLLIQTINTNTGDYYLYERESVLPLGFTYDSYVTRSEFENCSDEQRSILMLKTLVIPDAKEELVENTLRHYDMKEEGIPGEMDMPDLVKEHQETAAEFQQSHTGFACSLNAERDTYVFFSVPNDIGWRAKVNGTEAKIVDVNGLMAIAVPAGDSQIMFTYRNYFAELGMMISIIGFIIWICYSRRDKRKKD